MFVLALLAVLLAVSLGVDRDYQPYASNFVRSNSHIKADCRCSTEGQLAYNSVGVSNCESVGGKSCNYCSDDKSCTAVDQCVSKDQDCSLLMQVNY